MLGPGVQLGNRYRLDERIASGGMGDVWRGTDQVLGRTVAVKSLLPALLDEPGFAERFRGEARTMATINHPGVVDVYDFGSDQQIAFLVMEYVEGDALSATLGRVGRLTPARTMALLAQAADALHAAHEKGIVHRDVKPGNLLVRPNGTLVLTDFGIARSELVGQLTAAGSVLGTASYISPEQATGAVATPASDVYALGVVAYQCLAGRRPFEGDNPLEIAMKHVRDTPRPLPADIPPQVRAIVERAMAKEPGARWPSAAALASVARQAKLALSQQARGGRPISGVPASPAAPPARAQVPTAAPRPQPRPPVAPARPPVAPRPTMVAHPLPQPRPPVGPRGAAPVPQQPRPPHNPLAYARPSAPPPPAPRRSRSGLWTTAILVAVLVILCSGVISFWYRKYVAGAPGPASVSVTSGAVRAYGDDYPVRTSYRREVRLQPAGGGTTTSEGRETR
ncbi:serine/threonine-protein kinase [Micromonospora sp. WMMD1128]|uniref:serine/threonine-protein kinase n=1 Tax=unclassified Micromonospora TaxID=2617518 RepID=UPI00248BD29F|nr:MULTISPECIES: serine/threonine-protein kinase [unclassified Micromonospora]WBB73614.1 serine/threonine-protein kinase [Micromonospora sp. WMMD1128]WFE32993.1 serine/threonine-protein kinase [Micromonospora sp. WMMD975]